MHCKGPILRGKIFGRTYGRFDEFSGHKLKRLLLTESLLMFANIDESRKGISLMSINRSIGTSYFKQAKQGFK